jgi:transposase-like protein
VDQNVAYPPAVADLKEEEVLDESCQLRTCKYLNNIIEQDHRAIKRLSRAGLGFKSFSTARRTIDGYETMNMIRKGQVIGITKGTIKKQEAFIEAMFGIAA